MQKNTILDRRKNAEKSSRALLLWSLCSRSGLSFFTRYDSREEVNNFFHAIEQKDFEAAYGIYQADPDWKQHPEKYSSYTINQFKLDWGPSGEYGAITSHQVDCALEPPKKDFVSATGVVVVVTINNRQSPNLCGWKRKPRTVSDSPVKVLCHGQQ